MFTRYPKVSIALCGMKGHNIIDYIRCFRYGANIRCSSVQYVKKYSFGTVALDRTAFLTRNAQYGRYSNGTLELGNSCRGRSIFAPFGSHAVLRCDSSVVVSGRSRLHQSSQRQQQRTGSVVMYILAAGVFMVGAAYAGVPLYRMFCQSTGLGGEVQTGHNSAKVESLSPVKDRTLRIRFNADTASSMQWNFRPHQSEIKVLPGETALAFYKAKNPTDVPVIGISTYNVVPFEAAPYFNKIQCFCFEEQRLNPREEVDLPVFFYIDPEYCDDPKLEHVDIITLSYTFFEAKEGMTLPILNYAKPVHL